MGLFTAISFICSLEDDFFFPNKSLFPEQITGWVPLHEASWKGHEDCAIVLLNWDAPAMPRYDVFQDSLIVFSCCWYRLAISGCYGRRRLFA